MTKNLSIFGFTHELWTIPTTNMMDARSQNYTNMVVDKHGMQTFEVVVVVLWILLLSFDVFVPANAHPLIFLNKWFVQIYLNANSLLI